MPTESQFTQKLIRALKQHPALREAVIFKFNATGGSLQRGIPDFCIALGARTLWWEVKMRKNEPTKIQSYYLKKFGAGASLLRNCGAITWINDNEYFEFDALVSEIVRRCVNA